ncbi:glycosyltransferase [Novosphingobium colocasiae]
MTLVGNPVRADVLALRDAPFPAFTADSLFRILVTGGSQGARVLSDVVPDALAMLPSALRSRLQVTQQCRAEDIERVRARYVQHGIPAELGTYFEDMAERLAGAHLFIGRSGASTIAELTAVGRPAVLIPLPYAMDDHQSANAREMVAGGGARVIRQPPVTTEDADAHTGEKRNRLLSEQAEVHQRMAKDLCLQIQAIAQAPRCAGQRRALRLELRLSQRRQRSGRSGGKLRCHSDHGRDPRHHRIARRLGRRGAGQGVSFSERRRHRHRYHPLRRHRRHRHVRHRRGHA